MGLYVSGSGPAAFNPLAQGPLTCWLRGDANVLLTSGAVNSWQEKASTGYFFTQGTAATRPIFVANSANGQPGMTLSQSSAETLASTRPLSEFFTATTKTVFAVIKPTAIDPSPFNPEVNCVYLTDPGGGYFSMGIVSVAGVNKAFCNDFAGGDVTTPPIGNMALSAAHIICVHKSAGNLSCSVDGGADSTIACGPTTSLTHTLSVGIGTNFNMAGDVLEFLIYLDDIGPTNIAAVKAYLNGRYAAY